MTFEISSEALWAIGGCVGGFVLATAAWVGFISAVVRVGREAIDREGRDSARPKD